MEGDTLRYKITFSYDGSDFYGYQKQDGYRSVEGCLEEALYNINNHQETKIYSSGRTDRGVHARGQVGHFDLDVDITLYKLKCALNSLLPDDIHVIKTELVDNSFHARFLVKNKKYVYYLNCGEYNPLMRKYVYQYNRDLDFEKMQEAIKLLIGKHDFKNYVSDDCQKDSYVREIFDAYLEKNDNTIKFVFVGDGFMKYQVRNMVGTLIKVGKHKIDINDVGEILVNEGKKKLVMTAKAEGLYLEEVNY